MVMFRFFADPRDISAKSIKLSEEDSKHIRTLRFRPDEKFIVCDSDGTDYICKLGERADGSFAEIVEKRDSRGEPTVVCKVYMSYSKGDRLDYAVQKSVELGAHEIILFESERCVAVPKDIPKKVARLQRIALETAKQSGRGIIPSVSSGGHFYSVIDEAMQNTALSMFLYECEEQQSIKNVLEQHYSQQCNIEDKTTKPISIITGPEGGFEPLEAEMARSKGIRIVSLGSRILRSETAPVIALAAIMYQTGNL